MTSPSCWLLELLDSFVLETRVVLFPAALILYRKRSHQPPDELIQSKLKELILDAITMFVLNRRQRILDHCDPN